MEQPPRLSNRESEVVDLLMQGNSNKQIASALNISQRTVEFHLKNIYDKYQVSSRVELVLKLGESTVVDKAEVAENGERLNSGNWVTSLRDAVSEIGKELKVTKTLDTTARDAGTPMTFFESIRLCFIQYAEFNGRATRPEFWWFALFVTLVTSALAYFGEVWASVFLIAVLLPFLAVGTRRLRDSGKSGWWLLFLLVPVGGIITLGFLWAEPSTSKLPDDTLPA